MKEVIKDYAMYALFFAGFFGLVFITMYYCLSIFHDPTPKPDVARLLIERDSLRFEVMQWEIDYGACAKARYENRALNELPLRQCK